MHAVLEALYRERPGGDPVPRPGSLGPWIERGGALLAEKAAETGLSGDTPAERAMRRRIDLLLAAFLRRRSRARSRPPLPSAARGELRRTRRNEQAGPRPRRLAAEGTDRPGRRRCRRPPGLLHDYKVAAKANAVRPVRQEGEAAAAPLHARPARPVGDRPGRRRLPAAARREGPRPRGLIREDAGAELAGFELVDTDRLERGGLRGAASTRPGITASRRSADAGRRHRP